jgi:hypothetical protein
LHSAVIYGRCTSVAYVSWIVQGTYVFFLWVA